MRKNLLSLSIAASIGAIGLAACTTTAPNASQVQQIQTACAIDAGLRPTANALLAIPGLATPQEIAGVVAARAVIDPVCANPAGSVEANTIAAFTSATAQVVGIVTALKTRQPVPIPATTAPASAPSGGAKAS